MKTFEEALVAAFPKRFTGDLMEKESANLYAFGLLQGAVAAITRSAAPYVSDGPIASKAIDELLALAPASGADARRHDRSDAGLTDRIGCDRLRGCAINSSVARTRPTGPKGAGTDHGNIPRFFGGTE